LTPVFVTADDIGN